MNDAQKIASKYSSRYDVQGLFYNKNGEKCRKQLEIKRQNSPQTSPDLIVIMMNPGSSIQAPGFENEFGKLVPAVHDKTQEKIMDLLDFYNLNYARILNLSDLREKDSPTFYRYLKSQTRKIPKNSIFHESRIDELNLLMVPNVRIVIAWGVDDSLRPLAEKAIQYLKANKRLYSGLKKENSKFGYYHPQRRKLPPHKTSWYLEFTSAFPHISSPSSLYPP